MATRRRPSNVWKYFEQINDSNVQCKICSLKRACHCNTSSMINHLKLKHKEKTAEDDSRQSCITSFASSSPRCCDPAGAEQITQLLTKMITQDMLPLSFVEGQGFCELMGFVEPEYKVPSRRTITTRV
ncbi:calcyclin-binding protein isoform X1 [Acipenser oxyrinchus oxyrinchus]|uniref:Calcyclin-binding protein isoform X1 n=1 Tax=Acipenser oxyrinchus oxyrinchus TaxID=40147 RepID=A0AAD8GEE8_ACIOX|nr:calcyclin-binding protein isoform X1 [Acipenser oxyrinchus oxyrinchus]